MPNAQPVAPLTIIAVFAGIIEASALATLPFLSEDSQTLYTWFLVAFPFFLTALFFLTLNFNYKSFYVPDTALGETATHAMSPLSPSQVFTPTPVTVMFHGPHSQSMLRQQVLEALEYPNDTERSWLFLDLEKHQSINLTLGPLPKHTAALAP